MRHLMFLLAVVVSVLTATLAVSVDSIPTAEAVKASGIKIQQYGKNAQTSICGDRLCGADPSVSQDASSTNVPDSTNLNVIFQRMAKIQKQHQDQLREKWSSLDASEKILFSQKMHQMMDKMESMNVVEHLDKMMSGDMKGGHDESGKAKKHGDMKEKGRYTEKK